MDTQARTNAIRKAPWLAPRFWLAFGVLALGGAIAALRPAAAQEAASTDIATAEELHEIVGPIALYPDDLVAIVLPASTYPLQIVQAARFLEDRERDSSLKANEEWDDSVVALLNYPEVIKLLNDDLDWTYDLGTAVLNQRSDVLNAIQGFRDEAYAAGNLRSDERQTVAQEDDTIEIKPANPQVIYVPYYEPERVVVYQPAPVYYYYPRPYPVYYYPYPEHYHFSTGFFWGVNSWFSIGWHSHHVHVYDPFYYGHPYYGFTYYNPYYVRNVYVNVNNYYRYPNNVWQPHYRYGGRPAPVVRGSEGRVYTADRRPRHGNLDPNPGATRTREGSTYRPPGNTAARTVEGAAPANRTGPQRGAPSSSYRNRTTAGAQPQPTDTAQANGATRGTPQGRSTEARGPMGQSAQANNSRGRGTQPQQPAGQTAQPRDPPTSTTLTNPGAYRGNGGMSQAQRNRGAPQPSAGASTDLGAAVTRPGVSPRAHGNSTGMPRESARVAPAPAQRESAPVVREPYRGNGGGGGGMSAQRSESSGGGGGYRADAGANRGGGNSGGNGGGGGGSYRGGGGERGTHSAARHER